MPYGKSHWHYRSAMASNKAEISDPEEVTFHIRLDQLDPVSHPLHNRAGIPAGALRGCAGSTFCKSTILASACCQVRRVVR